MNATNKITILFILVSIVLHAQVGINTTTPNTNAELDVFSNNRGLLIPRITLVNTTDFSPLSAHVAGMIVYNTNTAGDVTPGFYYNDGTLWRRVATGIPVTSGWNINGNAGTNSNTNFLGTTTNQPVVFRVNNIPKLRLETNGTLATLNTGNSVFIGENAGTNDDLTNNNNVFIGRNSGNNNTTGENNLAVGQSSLTSNTIGNNNVSIGLNSLTNNVSGSDNIAIGALALETITNTNQNIGIGNQSLRYSTSSNNTGVGYWSGRQVTTGNNNTAVGSSSLLNLTSGSFNTAVGSDAFNTGTNYNNSTAIGYNTVVNGSNRIHLGNTSITAIRGQVNFSTYSDGRIKENIKEDVKGLDFILRLRPVTYNLNIDEQNKILGVTDRNNHTSKYDIEKIKFSGFIAQEVEQAAKDADYQFSGVIVPENENDLYTVSYSEFVVPLVKSVQEQQKQIEELEELVRKLKEKETKK